jgi:Skp family chaperone for outer membrane proteins
MKIILRFLFISLFFFFNNNVFSSENIVYLNFDYIIAESKAGLSIDSQLQINHKKNLKKFTAIEKKLKEKEAKIISKK